jgi:hypothetical protein
VTTSTTMPAVIPPPTSSAAMERHLDEWTSSALQGAMFSFHGIEGVYKLTDGSGEIPLDTEVIGIIDEVRRGWIKFNEGNPPDVRMVALNEDADVPKREELGDDDPSEWPFNMNGVQADPWQPQYAVPMQRRDAGGELLCFVARSLTSMNAVEQLLGRYRYHPRARAGFYPVIKLAAGSYTNKRFGGQKPKPLLPIIDWVQRDGTPITAPQPELSAEMNDKIPF